MPQRLSFLARPSRDQLTVLRLALRLTAGLLSTTGFTIGQQPFGNGYEAQQWLRQQLAPLARRDRFIREMIAVLDPENPPRQWASSRTAKRELLRLAARTQALAGVKRMCHPDHNARPLSRG